MVLAIGRASFAQTPAQPQDPGWPRQKSSPDGKLIYYHPHFDQWVNFKQLNGRMAVSITPTGGHTTLGVVELQIETDSDLTTRLVRLYNPKIIETRFPSVDEPTAAKLDKLVRSYLPSDATISISLDRVIASTEKPALNPAAGLKHDPPPI